MTTCTPLALLIAVAGVAAISAQGPPSVPPTLPAFDVASIKPNNSGDFGMSALPQPGGVNFVNMPLRQLILRAYQLQDSQLVGGPDWVTTERFDVLARRAGDSAPGQTPLMLRRLLADRFGLVVQHEQREQQAYALMLARSDGRLGPGLQKSSADCQAIIAALVRAGGPGPTGEPTGGGRLNCATTMRPGTLVFGGTTLSRLAVLLAGFVNQLVVDRTGLTGTYDIELAWTADIPDGPPPVSASRPPVSDAGSIFTALKDQLGLRLELQRVPVDVVVITKVNRPTPN